MKNLTILLFFGLIVVNIEIVNAQTQQNQSKNLNSAGIISTDDKSKSVDPASAVSSESATSDIQKDADGKSYMMVDGRKVFIDGNGVQSLGAPTELKKEIIPVKEDKKQPEN